MQQTLSQSPFYQMILSAPKRSTTQGTNRLQEEFYWYEVNIGDRQIFIPNCIYTERTILDKVVLTNNEDKELFYCICSRHSNIKIKLRALKKLESMETRSNWTIPFLMRGLKDRNLAVQSRCKKLLSTYDAREIERIAYLNKEFILDITSKVINLG